MTEPREPRSNNVDPLAGVNHAWFAHLAVNKLGTEEKIKNTLRGIVSCEETATNDYMFTALGELGHVLDEVDYDDENPEQSAFLVGACIALDLADELAESLGVSCEEYRQNWIDSPSFFPLVDLTDSGLTVEQKRALNLEVLRETSQHRYTRLEPEYKELVSHLQLLVESHMVLPQHMQSAIWGFSFTYMGVREGIRLAIADDAEENKLNDTDSSWVDTLVERCYEVRPGEEIDISIELQRVQGYFEWLCSDFPLVDHRSAEQITDKITDELVEDDSMERVLIPDGARVKISQAVYVLVYPAEQIDTGPQEDTILESLDEGDTLEGEHGHIAAVSKHPPGDVVPDEWVLNQTFVYGPAVVIKNAILRSGDGTIKAIYDDKALLVSLDHPSLRVRYVVDSVE